MKASVLFFVLLLLSACASHKHNGTPCTNPKGHDCDPVSPVAKVEEGTLVYPLIIHTYSLDVAANPQRIIDSLNQAFKQAKVQFEYQKTVLFSFPEMEELAARTYKKYYEISELLDEDNTLSIWVVPSGEVCDRNGCSSTSGFSNINGTPSNIVVTDIGWRNTAVVVHEMGHWFGLDHTTDDDLSDTPYDPGAQYAVYISYDDCEMYHPDGHKPLIENFMSYYGYCPSRRKSFTPMQLDRINRVSWLYKVAYAKR